MLDKQLAELLVQIGLERNADVDTIAAELTAMRLPEFVDSAAFKASLIDAIESQLRKQTDDRIRKLRASIGSEQPAAAPVAPPPAPAATPPPVPVSPSDTLAPEADVFKTIVEPANLPSDATMVWKGRDQG